MPPLHTLMITDGRTGNVRQAQALATAMAAHLNATSVYPLKECESITIQLRKPWSWFAPRLTRFASAALPHDLIQRVVHSEARFLVIGCGRAAAFATRALRELAPDRVFAIQILDPRIDAKHWNLIIAPLHDELRGENVLNSVGALNRIDDVLLQKAAAEFSELRQLPAPRTAVLIGGTTRAQVLDEAYFAGLFEALKTWHQADGGGFMVTTSRRTPESLLPMIQSHLKTLPHRLWQSDRDGINPYLGYLAHAQRIVVTPDSVNLISEACATGKPVFCHTPQPIRGKLQHFHQELTRGGHLQSLQRGESKPSRGYPLRETEAIAALATARFQSWLMALS